MQGWGGIHHLVGDIYGASVPMVVSAWVSGVEISRTYLEAINFYSFNIDLCEDKGVAVEGAVVRFSIDGFWAKETTALLSGAMEVLDLTKTDDPVVIN
jgi:hypothetical protein